MTPDAEARLAQVLAGHMTPAELKAARKRLRLTQVEFAAQMGVTTQTVAAWEQDRYPIPLYVAKALTYMAPAPTTWRAIVATPDPLNLEMAGVPDGAFADYMAAAKHADSYRRRAYGTLALPEARVILVVLNKGEQPE